jgi:tumor protein p53-inducible protein 3
VLYVCVCVCVFPQGYAEYVTVSAGLALHVPAELTLKQAVCIPEVWATAYQLVVLLGEVKANDSVLIHAGASGVGLAAIQLVRSLGAVPMVTVGRDTKLTACLAPPFSASHGWVVDRQTPRFADQVLAAAPKGVSVILDSVGTSYWGQNGQSIAADGRWVLYATMGGAAFNAGDALSDLFRKRVRLQATTLRTRSLDYKIDLMQRVATLLPKFASGELQLPIARVFSLAHVSQAHLMMEADGMCPWWFVHVCGFLCRCSRRICSSLFYVSRRQHGENFARSVGRMTKAICS